MSRSETWMWGFLVALIIAGAVVVFLVATGRIRCAEGERFVTVGRALACAKRDSGQE